MSRTPGWRGILGGALVLAAAAFLGRTIARHSAQLEAFQWEIRWLALAASVVALVGALCWGVFIWKLVLDRFDHPPIRFSALLRIWFLSNLARYIPGKVWQFVGAAELARLAGLPRALVLTSIVVHMGFTLLAAAVLAAVVLLPTGLVAGGSGAGLVVVASLSVVLVHPALLDTGLRLMARFVHRDVLRWRGRWRDGLGLLFLSLASWLVYGAAFALFVHSIVAIPAGAIVPLAAVNALSFLVGYLVFLAPAGLGAREGAMSVLLRPYAPVGVAAVIAVLSRLWTVAAELLGAGLVLVWTRRRHADAATSRRNW